MSNCILLSILLKIICAVIAKKVFLFLKAKKSFFNK